MASGFKAQVKRDLDKVFYNADEHADMAHVEYNGKKYHIPVVFNHDGTKDRVRRTNDNADGVFIADLTVHISFYDLKIVPRKETKIKINAADYNIVKTGNEAGDIILDLELMDE